MWSSLSSLVGSKQLSSNDIAPVIAKMQDHLIGKNVAADVAINLCKSVANKLEGKVMGKWTTIVSCQARAAWVVDTLFLVQERSKLCTAR